LFLKIETQEDSDPTHQTIEHLWTWRKSTVCREPRLCVTPYF